MLPMLQKHALITAAILASLSITACGSKKDVLAQPPAPTATPAPSPASGAPADKTADTNGTLGGGLPDPAGQGTDDLAPPSTLPPLPGGDNGTLTPLPPLPGGPTGSPNTPPSPRLPPVPNTTPPVTNTLPAPAPGSNVLPNDYRSDDVQSGTRDNVAKRLTGGVTSDGLVYTSSSTDDVLDFLRARNERVGFDARRANLEAASSVISAKLVSENLGGDAVVTLKIQEGREVKVYNVAGGSGAEGTSSLRSVRSGNGERTTGTRALSGTIKCIDLDGGCETSFVRLQIGTSPSTAILNFIFRKSSADLYFHLPGDRSDNPEYADIREFALNLVQDVRSSNRIKTSTMSSWEVVNGRSGMTVALKGYNNELLAFSGPLLAPEGGSSVNVPLSRIAKDDTGSLDLVTVSNSKLNYANTIADARLVANNGLGQVRISLKMRKRGTYAQDQFAVTFMRRIKPIVDLTDDNLK